MSGVFHKRVYETPVSRAAVAADFPRFSFGVFNDPPGQIWPDFVHDTEEFVVVAEGDLEITVEGDTARCGPGDLVLIPSGARHTLKTSAECGSTWYYGYGHLGESDA